MARSFILLEETKESINKFSIGYIINSRLNINKVFREQVHKCTNNKFGSSTKPFIKATLEEILNKRVSIINVL